MNLRIACLILLLTGCATTGTAPAPHVVVTPTGPATGKEIETLNQQIVELRKSFETQRDLAQIVAGAVWGAMDANDKNPAGLPKEATAAQLEEAAKAGPKPTDAQKVEKANQNARILAGQLAEVKAEMGQKAGEIEALKVKLTDSQNRATEIAGQLAAVSAAGAKERADAAATLQAQFDTMTKEIDAANARAKQAAEEANNKILLEQVAWLNRSGAACAGLLVAVVGLASVFGGIAALRAVAPFALLLLLGALIGFGLAQIVALWWFKWAVLTAVGLILGLCAWWAIRHYQLGTLQADTAEKADKVKGVVLQTLPVLDAAYESASKEIKEFMDEHIFGKLSSKMDATDKATVHELRAEITNPPTK